MAKIIQVTLPKARCMSASKSQQLEQGSFECPLCFRKVNGNPRLHLLEVHGEDGLRHAILADKERGVSDSELGKRYGISFSTLERMITEACGANVSILKRPKQIKQWQPSDFREETTTVWSFKQRGNWATHDGRYRGNWSPYIPRNVILKYSKPGDIVLDYFSGGGTTAVEAKLLGRRCIAMDINPDAVNITRENLEFSLPEQFFSDSPQVYYEPEVSVGDARNLAGIPDNSVDLICAHPPYAGIIQYSRKIPGDLSGLSIQDFLVEMRKVAMESLRVLKPGGKCVILVGDTRKSKRIIPIGFQTIRVFLDVGFALRELVIKRQHNCRTTGFWYTRSIQYNFLLLAHEYLPVLEKPFAGQVREQGALWEYTLPYRSIPEKVRRVVEERLETTTVWIFPQERLEQEVKRNLLQRFADLGGDIVEIAWDDECDFASPGRPANLAYVRWPQHDMTQQRFVGYRGAVRKLIEQNIVCQGGFLVLEAMDFRSGGMLQPAGLILYEDLETCRDLLLKEIVIVVPEMLPPPWASTDLEIVHRYLLIYVRK